MRCWPGRPGGARPVFETVGDELVENSFAVLHGLYRLTVNLAADGPAAAGRRRRAVVRRCVAALPGLPGQTAGRAAGAGGDHGAHRRTPARRRAARRPDARTVRHRVAAAGAVRRGDRCRGAHPVGVRRRGLRDDVPSDDVGQPPAVAPVGPRAGVRGGSAGRGARRHRASRRFPRGGQPGHAPAAPDAGCRGGGGQGGGVHRRRCRPARDRGAGPAPGGTGRGGTGPAQPR